MANINDILSAVPQSLLLGFAGIGALYLGSKTLAYLQFLLNVFVLSGTNVSLCAIPNCHCPWLAPL